MNAYRCPTCERITSRPGTCSGSASDPHPPARRKRADHLREALEVGQRARVVTQDDLGTRDLS